MRKAISQVLQSVYEQDHVTVELEEGEHLVGDNLQAHLAHLEKRMHEAAADLEFEEAARLRDEIHRLEGRDLEIPERALDTRTLPGGAGAHPRASKRKRKSKSRSRR